MPSTYGAAGIIEEETSQGYQTENEKLSVGQKQNKDVTSKVVVAVGLFAMVGTFASMGYMPKIRPVAELAEALGCDEQMGCAQHNSKCSDFDASKISCAVAEEGYAFMGDIIMQCTEQDGCEESAKKCVAEPHLRDHWFGEVDHTTLMHCDVPMAGFYTFEGVIGKCDTVENAIQPVECTSPQVEPASCAEQKFSATVTVEGVTKSIVSMDGIGDKFKKTLFEALPPTPEGGVEVTDIVVHDDKEYSYSYDRRLTEGKRCKTNSGESCAKYLYTNLIGGDNDQEKCAMVDRLMNDGPTPEEEKQIAGWEAQVEAQGCFEEVSKENFPEKCLEPEFRLHCEEVFNAAGDRRLSLWDDKQPQQNQRFLSHPELGEDSKTVSYTFEFSYKFCGLPPPDVLGSHDLEDMIMKKVIGETQDIEKVAEAMNLHISSVMSEFTGTHLVATMTDGGVHGDPIITEDKIVTSPDLIFTCLPPFLKSEDPDLCTACTMQEFCTAPVDPKTCSAVLVDKLTCATTEDGYYTEDGIVKECTPVKNCDGGVTCSAGGASTCHGCPDNHYHVDDVHDECHMCKKQSCCSNEGILGSVCSASSGEIIGSDGAVEPLSEYLSCHDATDGFYLAEDVCHVCPTGDHVGPSTCSLPGSDCDAGAPAIVSKFSECKTGYKYYHKTGACVSDVCAECVEQDQCVKSSETCAASSNPDLCCLESAKGYYTQSCMVKECPDVAHAAEGEVKCAYDALSGKVVIEVEECVAGYVVSSTGDSCVRCAEQDLCAAHEEKCFMDSDVPTLVCTEPKSIYDIYLKDGKAGACHPVDNAISTKCTGPSEAEIAGVHCKNMHFKEGKTCPSCVGSKFSPNVKSFLDIEGCVIDQCHSGYEHPPKIPSFDRKLSSEKEPFKFEFKKQMGPPELFTACPPGSTMRNHQYDNGDGSPNCECVENGDPCESDMGPKGAHCIVDARCLGVFEQKLDFIPDLGHVDPVTLGCVNIDYCKKSPCSPAQTCEDASPPKDGSEEEENFFCHCPEGKSGLTSTNEPAACVDVDNCPGKECGYAAICKDHKFDSDYGPHAYQCVCDAGAEGESQVNKAATCTNIDGCAGFECGSNADCHDHPFPQTGRSCQCKSGFFNNGEPGGDANNDAHANTAVDCVASKAQPGCAESVEGKFCESCDTIAYLSCAKAADGYMLEGDKVVDCPLKPDTMIKSTVICDANGVPSGICIANHHPEPFDGRDQMTKQCLECEPQEGCKKDLDHCSVVKPTMLSCDEAHPDYILKDTDIVVKARRLRGE